jgi:rhodanese-related sulfurtransferase
MQTLTEVTRVMPEEVKERMYRGERFTFVDSRNPKDWGESDLKLPGAIRMTPEDAQKQVGDLPRDQTIITYCT